MYRTSYLPRFTVLLWIAFHANTFPQKVELFRPWKFSFQILLEKMGLFGTRDGLYHSWEVSCLNVSSLWLLSSPGWGFATSFTISGSTCPVLLSALFPFFPNVSYVSQSEDLPFSMLLTSFFSFQALPFSKRGKASFLSKFISGSASQRIQWTQ